jgi:hypothetical protein
MRAVAELSEIVAADALELGADKSLHWPPPRRLAPDALMAIGAVNTWKRKRLTVFCVCAIGPTRIDDVATAAQVVANLTPHAVVVRTHNDRRPTADRQRRSEQGRLALIGAVVASLVTSHARRDRGPPSLMASLPSPRQRIIREVCLVADEQKRSAAYNPTCESTCVT